MAKSMTPSDITVGQIAKVQELLGAGLRKSGLPSEAFQQVLKEQGRALTAELVQVVRKFVERVSSIISRFVVVDSTSTPEQTLNATDRIKYVDYSVLRTAPMGESGEVRVEFIKIGRYVTDDEIEAQLTGTRPATFAEIAKANQDDPTLADATPNGTHWKDSEGKWCYAAFRRFDGERDVSVHRDDGKWDGNWSFARVRK